MKRLLILTPASTLNNDQEETDVNIYLYSSLFAPLFLTNLPSSSNLHFSSSHSQSSKHSDHSLNHDGRLFFLWPPSPSFPLPKFPLLFSESNPEQKLSLLSLSPLLIILDSISLNISSKRVIISFCLTIHLQSSPPTKTQNNPILLIITINILIN